VYECIYEQICERKNLPESGRIARPTSVTGDHEGDGKKGK
jgi:hypothetical protein